MQSRAIFHVLATFHDSETGNNQKFTIKDINMKWANKKLRVFELKGQFIECNQTEDMFPCHLGR